VAGVLAVPPGELAIDLSSRDFLSFGWVLSFPFVWTNRPETTDQPRDNDNAKPNRIADLQGL
jgi:hypothetical protein